MYTHKKTGRVVDLHVGVDGFVRLVAYVPKDKHWKDEGRQIRATIAQAMAAVARGELYVSIDVGTGTRSLIHSSNLKAR